jgi:type IV pilus assembly protein PilX
MSALRRTCIAGTGARERGAVLFVALIALVTLMLAAVALTRSVDTAIVISGNLAFKQAATASADNGLESAIKWLAKINSDNISKDPFTDATHAFNQTNAAVGYYSNVDNTLNFKADATWTDAASKLVAADPSGNQARYIIQRMCRDANTLLSESNCLFSDAEIDTGSKRVKPASEAGAKVTGKVPLNRVTIRVTGPRNTVSYTQAFVY